MQAEDRFKSNTISLAEYIMDINTDAQKRKINLIDNTVLSIAVNILSSISAKTMIEKFITISKDSWDKIHAHDSVYFRQRTPMFFAGLPEKVVENMGELLMGHDSNGNYYIQEEVRKTIWAYMESFVKISLRYLAPDGKGFLDKKEFEELVKKWKVTL